MSTRGWPDHPLVQLTLVRFREFFREPEAVFWVFVFPVLLAAGLGIAFRNQAPERIARGRGRRRAASAGGDARRCGQQPGRLAARARRVRGRRRLCAPGMSRWSSCLSPATGSSTASMTAGPRAGPPGSWWTTRSSAPPAAGDPVTRDATGRCASAGSRYIDFLVPGLLGMNLMGSGIWGIGFAIVDARRRSCSSGSSRRRCRGSNTWRRSSFRG